MTTSKRKRERAYNKQNTTQQEKWYRISESQLKRLEQCGVERCDGGCPDSICPYHIAEEIRATPLFPAFNSTELLILAHDEWKRREERKHNHPENHWAAGFLSGFLTDHKWARECVDKLMGRAKP